MASAVESVNSAVAEEVPTASESPTAVIAAALSPAKPSPQSATATFTVAEASVADGFATEDPGSPVQSPLAWALLAWSRRTEARSIMVTATVDGNSAPVAGEPVVGAPDLNTGAVTGSLEFTDLDGDLLSYSVITQAAKGRIVIGPGGTFLYTPTQAARLAAFKTSGPDGDTFTVSASDGQAEATTTVSVVIAPAKLVLTTPVAGLAGPTNAAFSPDGARAYVTESGNHRIMVFDTATNAVVDSIDIDEAFGAHPQDIAVSPDGTRLYVTTARNSVWIVDATTNTALRAIAVPESAENIAVSPDGTRAYVTGYSRNKVSVIDLNTESVVATIDGFNGPLHVAVGNDGTRAYVTNTVNGPGSVMVIDTTTNTVIDTIRVGPVWSGFLPYGLAVSADGSRLYTADLINSKVTVISTADNTVVDLLDGPLNPTAVALSPDGSLAYVTSQGDDTVSVIDLSTGAIVQSFQFADHQFSVTTSPDGTRIYIPGSNGNVVSVLSVVSGINGAPKSGALTIDSTDSATGAVRGSLNFTDEDGDSLAYTVVSNAAKGDLVINSDGTFVYTPTAAARHAAAADGVSPSVFNDSFIITASDGQASATGSFGLTILPANKVPTPPGSVAAVPGLTNLASDFIMSSDGKRVYVEVFDPVTSSISLAIVDTETKDFTLVPLQGQADYFSNLGEYTPIVVSSDGRHVYVAQINPATQTHFVEAVDVVAGTSTTVAFPRQAQLHISPDGRYVYGLNLDSVSILNTTTSQVSTTALPYGVYKKLIVRPDSTGVVVADYNVMAVVNNDGTVLFHTPSERYSATPLVSPDGRYAYVTSMGVYRTEVYLGIVDIATGTSREVLLPATSVTVGPDGRLYTITDHDTLTVLDEKGDVVHSVALGGTYDVVVMSADGQRLIARPALYGYGGPGGPSLALVDVTSSQVRTITLDHPADYVVFSPDGAHAVAGSLFSADQKFSVIDTGAATATAFLVAGSLDATNCAFTSDGEHFSTVVYDNDGAWALVTVNTQTLTMATLDIPGYFEWQLSGFTADGRQFYGGIYDEATEREIVVAVAIPLEEASGVIIGTPAAVTGAVIGSVAYVDPDNDVLSYSINNAPTRGTVTLDASSGQFTYTPIIRETTSTTDTFTVLVSDGHGGRVPVVVSVAVAAANVAPTVTIAAPTPPDAATGMVSLTVNASDAGGDTLTFTFVAGKGSVTANSDGTYTYTPTAVARHGAAADDASAADKEDTITVTVTDTAGLSATSSVTVTLSPANIAPRRGRSISFLDPSTGSIGVDLFWNDPDGDTMTFTLIPADATKGTFLVGENGAYRFTPTTAARRAAAKDAAPESDRIITFTLTADDGHGGVTTLPLSLPITPLNAVPVAAATTSTPNSSGVVTGRVTATDADRDVLTYSVGSVPARGTVVVDASGRFTYMPTAAARHAAAATDTAQTQDSFTLAVSDGYGGVASVPITVQIGPKNAVPTVTVTKGAPDPVTSITVGKLVAADADADTLDYTVTSGPGKGTVAVAADGAFTYTPTVEARHAAAKAGALTADKRDAFTVTVSDGHGGTRTVTVTTQVLPQNTKPTGTPLVAGPDGATGTVSGTVGGVDADSDALTYSVTRGPTKGTVALGADGDFVYTPTDAARHTASATNATTAQKQDTFTVTVADSYGGKTAVVVTAAIAPANMAPSVTATVGSPASNGQVTGMVTAVDTDGDTLRYQVSQSSAKGAVTVGSTGKFTYTPTLAARHAAAALTATEDDKRDTFTITVADGHGGTASVTVTATIAPRNSAPTATPTRSTPSTSTGSVDGALGAKDADSDALTYLLTTGPSKGTVTVNADGSYTYVPTVEARIQAGARTATTADKRDTFTITINDGYGGSKAVTITATISGVAV